MKKTVCHNKALVHYFSRREFLALSGASFAAFLAGCATNPVSGRRQLMLQTREDELRLDKQQSPHQFSADYGVVQDRALNDYLNRVGISLAEKSHRPNVPYSFQGVNAVYINAYAFPGGSIAVTRGILLNLENEAELAALLGHEIGHVCARHTAARMTKGILSQLALVAVQAYVSQEYEEYQALASTFGGLAGGALLAHYSRENERQADALGLKYMAKAGYNPEGMVELMDMLRASSKRSPGLLDLMFATHPMSEERYKTAVETVTTEYSQSKDMPLYKERYMDNTAGLRSKAPGIEIMQDGLSEMQQGNIDSAQDYFTAALKKLPDDYTCLLLIAQCGLAKKRWQQAIKYAQEAKQAYQGEALAYQVSGLARVRSGQYGSAYDDFCAYERLLPGNPETTFFKGYCLEYMGKKEEATRYYSEYLKHVYQGKHAEYARRRLHEWGF